MSKKTPLYDVHIKYGGDMVDFVGYSLPIKYNDYGVMVEHKTTRTSAGIFDVSHMAEFIISGAKAEETVNYILSNDVTDMYDGQVRYSLLPNDNGGAVDDVLVYRFNKTKFLLVVNAVNEKKDEEWIKTKLPSRCIKFENVSEQTAQIALQGPKHKEIMLKLVKEESLPAKYYSFIDNVKIKDVKCLVSKTGYTGELGYEFYCKNEDAIKLYEYLMEAGKEFGLIPCGLGARDTLRLEAGMPLYGHELADDYILNEVELGFAIKMNKADFVGKQAILNHTPVYTKIGVKVNKGIARENDLVYCGDEVVGKVTSGTHAPFLGYPIAVLRVKKEFADKKLTAEVRGRKLDLEQTQYPFYKRG